MRLTRSLAFVSAVNLGLLPAVARGQSAGKPAVRVQAAVGDVTDNRTTGSFFSECKVEVKFTGDAAADAATVRRVRLTEAVDEVGRDLRPEGGEETSSGFFSPGHSSGALKTEVKLKNPSRNATVIKTLKGEADLFHPTEANGGILRIKNVLSHPAEPIQNPALKKYGVEIMYLTKESYEAKKKEIEAQQKSNAGSQLGAAFGEIFQGMFGGMVSSSKDSIQMYVKDPDKRVVDLEFQDAQGQPLKTNGRMSSSEFHRTDLRAPPPADTQLVIQLAVPEAVKTCSFELHDIPLP